MSVAMPPAATVDTSPELDVDALVRSIATSPHPALLTEVQREVAADDPNCGRIARIGGMDVAMTAAVLRNVNSLF